MTCSTTCCRTTGERPTESWRWTPLEDAHEQVSIAASAVYPASLASGHATGGRRDRREVHRIDRPLLRHGHLPAVADHRGAGVDRAERRGGQPALGPLPIHPAQPGVFHPGRLRGAADPAGPEPPREPRPGNPRGGSPTSPRDEGRYRISGA